jgi:hypothetical protein
MLSKLIIFGAGYVLGSKAGRERYNQIIAFAQEAARRLDEYGANDRFPIAGWWGNPSEGPRGSAQSKY